MKKWIKNLKKQFLNANRLQSTTICNQKPSFYQILTHVSKSLRAFSPYFCHLFYEREMIKKSCLFNNNTTSTTGTSACQTGFLLPISWWARFWFQVFFCSIKFVRLSDARKITFNLWNSKTPFTITEGQSKNIRNHIFD